MKTPDKGKQRRPKKKIMPRVSLGAIVSENLPLPIVQYPGHYGTFFGFSQDRDTSVVMCTCAQIPLLNYIKLHKLNFSENNYQAKLHSEFPAAITKLLVKWDGNFPLPFDFGKGICHKCNHISPTLRYCHEMYGTRFLQYYGWYVNQTYLRLGILLSYFPSETKYLNEICPKEIQNDIDEINTLEKISPTDNQALIDYLSKNVNWNKSDSSLQFWNNLRRENPQYWENIEVIISRKRRDFSNKIENITREELGFKHIGEGWVNETILYQIIKRIFPHREVIFHSKPAWLNGLEIDVYIPSLKIGFEYQGEQHYHPVNNWGGIKALEEIQKRDARKMYLCLEYDVRLITVDFTEPLTEDYIRRLINLP